jgi:hypothetical protein
MFVTFRPDGQVQGRWEFVPGDVRQSEAELIEKRAGQSWEQFLATVQSGNSKARRVLLWHLLRTQGGHHALRFEDVPDFRMSELKVEHSRSELVGIRDRMARADIDEATRDQMLAAIDLDIADAVDTAGDDAEGKAS